jgi:hypothetical protein
VTGALNHLAVMPVIDPDKGQSDYTKIVSSKPHKVILKRDSSHPVDFYRYVGALQVVLGARERWLEPIATEKYRLPTARANRAAQRAIGNNWTVEWA